MAKYIKTEEGYKEYNQIEGAASILKGGEFVEIKDGVVDTNYGDLVFEGNEKEVVVANTEMPFMSESSSLGGQYFCTLTLTPTTIAVGDKYNIEITEQNNSYSYTSSTLLTNVDVGMASYYGQYGLKFSMTGANSGFTVTIIISSDGKRGFVASGRDLAYCKIKLSKIVGKKDEYKFLPKTALEYDSKPYPNSDNLVKSGTIYEALQDVRIVAGNNMKIENGIIEGRYGEEGKVEVETSLRIANKKAIGGQVAGYSYIIGEEWYPDFPPNNSITIKIEDANGRIYLDGTYKNSDDFDGYYNCNNYIVTYTWDEVTEFRLKAPIALPETTYVTLYLNHPIEVDGIVKLPKTALDYDENPTQDSDNLMTSGSIYTVVQNLQSQITSIPKFTISVVTELPTTDISTTTVYLVKDTETEGNFYTEYVYINDAWEELGTQSGGLGGYAKAEDVAYTTPYMPGATNVKEALDATGEGFVSITQNINNIHENFMRTADAEQKIEEALADAKASGEFKGEKGESIAVRNINQSTEDGGENIVYFTDGNVLSVKNGNTGAKGKDGVNGKDGANGIDGKNGVTFTPIVSDDGTLSWTNDGELENPAEINIKGEAGKSGVYIGDGDMPDDCDVQINPNGAVISFASIVDAVIAQLPKAEEDEF